MSAQADTPAGTPLARVTTAGTGSLRRAEDLGHSDFLGIPTHASQVIGTPVTLPNTSSGVYEMQPNELAKHILKLPYRVARAGGRIKGKILPETIDYPSRRELVHVDSLAILDCCYAGSARSMQFRAAAGPSEEARSRSWGASFTIRLRLAVRTLRASGMPIVTIAALFAELKRAKPSTTTPTSQLAILGGSYPITLPFKRGRVMFPTSRIIVTPTSDVYEKHILVTITLRSRHKDVREEFCEIIRKCQAISV
ncbi:hypothetical protein N7490_011643 [Penicillium lividum]|nr:hypothetical protein N7490_011643 [Penicillium lividum]